MKVHIVKEKREDGEIRVLHVCSDYGDAVQKFRGKPLEIGTTWIDSYDVEDPVVSVPYRVWVTFAESGPTFEAKELLSIPLQKGVFVPLEPGCTAHGSITVDATSEEDAIAQARSVLSLYFTEKPAEKQAPAVPRRGNGGLV